MKNNDYKNSNKSKLIMKQQEIYDKPLLTRSSKTAKMTTQHSKKSYVKSGFFQTEQQLAPSYAYFSRNLRLDNNNMRIAEGSCLSTDNYEAHECTCGSLSQDDMNFHALS